MRIMSIVFWAISICGALAGAVTMLDSNQDKSAPQQAARAGMAIAFAVIPYVLARSIDGILKPWVDSEQERTQTKLLAAIANATNPVERVVEENRAD